MINLLFDAGIKHNNQTTYFIANTMVDYQSSSLIQVIPNSIASVDIQSNLTFGKPFNLLFIFNRLQPCILFIEPLVNRFKFSPIHNKGCPIGINTSSQVIQSQIDSHRTIFYCFYWFNLTQADVFDFKKSSIIFRVNPNFFDCFGVESFRKIKHNLAKLLFESRGHGYFK